MANINIMKQVLIINAHQKYEGVSEGKLNKTLAQQAKSFFTAKGIVVADTILEDGYNVEEEVEKHLNSDLVIIQTPVYWANLPWTYKKYADEVFNGGLFGKTMAKHDGRVMGEPTQQYGSGGLMDGKKMFISATWNAPKAAFNDKNQVWLEGKSADDLLLNITANYKFFGYGIIPGYHAHDVIKNPEPENYFANYDTYLENILQLFNPIK